MSLYLRPSRFFGGAITPHQLILAILVLLTSAASFSQDQKSVLENRLEAATGSDKLEVLQALMDLHVGRQPNNVLEYGHQALPLFEQFPNIDAEARVRLEMSSAYFRLGDYEQAVIFAENGLNLALQINNKGMESAANNMLGNIYATRGDYAQALQFYSQTLKIKEELGVQSGVASALNNIAIVYRRMGDFDRALETYFKSLGINEKLGRKKEMGRTLNNIAAVYDSIGSPELALEYSLKALALKEKLGNQLDVAPTLNNIGHLQLQLGNHADALTYLNRSLAIKRELGAKAGIASSLGSIGNVYLQMGKMEKAEQYFLEALQIHEAIGDQWGATGLHLALGNLYRKLGRLVESRRHIDHMLTLAEASETKTELRTGYRELAETQAAQSDYQNALASFKRYKEVHDEIVNAETGFNIGQMQARYEADQRAKEIALLKKDNDIQTLEIARQKLLRNVWVIAVAGMTLLIGLVVFLQNRRTQHKRLEEKVQERTQALREIQAQMVETAHRAGMAEIAIDVLHNVGNSLNSVNASAGMLLENLHETRPLKILDGIVGLIEEQSETLGTFLSTDERGKAIPKALFKINSGLRKKQRQLIDEVIQLKHGLSAVNDLIKAQDEYVTGFDREETRGSEQVCGAIPQQT